MLTTFRVCWYAIEEVTGHRFGYADVSEGPEDQWCSNIWSKRGFIGESQRSPNGFANGPRLVICTAYPIYGSRDRLPKYMAHLFRSCSSPFRIGSFLRISSSLMCSVLKAFRWFESVRRIYKFHGDSRPINHSATFIFCPKGIGPIREKA